MYSAPILPEPNFHVNRPYGYRGLKIFTSLKLRFQDFQRWPTALNNQTVSLTLRELHWLLDGLSYQQVHAHTTISGLKKQLIKRLYFGLYVNLSG